MNVLMFQGLGMYGSEVAANVSHNPRDESAYETQPIELIYVFPQAPETSKAIYGNFHSVAH